MIQKVNAPMITEISYYRRLPFTPIRLGHISLVVALISRFDTPDTYVAISTTGRDEVVRPTA